MKSKTNVVLPLLVLAASIPAQEAIVASPRGAGRLAASILPGGRGGASGCGAHLCVPYVSHSPRGSHHVRSVGVPPA